MTDPTGREASKTITVTLDFDGATWGDLRQFVEMAEDIPDDHGLVYETHPCDDETPTGLRANLPRAYR